MIVGLLTFGAAPSLTSCASTKGATVDELTTLNGEGFSVLMPGKPERLVKTAPSAAGPVDVTFYLIPKGNTAYTVSVFAVPEGVQFDLDGAVSSVASSVGGKVADSAETTYQGFPARDARITGARDKNGKKGKKGTIFTRAVISGDHFYQLQFIAEGGDVTAPSPVYTKLRDSLKIG